MKLQIIFAMTLMLQTFAKADQLKSCIPSEGPTLTPHCLLSRVYTKDKLPIFQLERQPYGTCESNTIAAGTIIQVMGAAIENSITNHRLLCATITFQGELASSYGVTPSCTVSKELSDGNYALFHSNSKEPLFVGRREEMNNFKIKLLKASSSICGQGIFEESFR